MARWQTIGVVVSLHCAAAAGARADVFHLESGGVVRGDLLNKDQSPRETYVVKTTAGGQIALPAAQVQKVDKQSPVEAKFDRLKLSTPDTAAGHWELAEFCRENRLPEQRKSHLEKVIELEPNHEQARHALGFTLVKGKWSTQEQGMNEDGRVRYRGAWRLPQEVELMERERKAELAQKDWFKKIKRWRGWLDTGKSEQGKANIASIDDPFAAKGLAWYLSHERDREVKMLWVEALARVGGPAAMGALVSSSVEDDDEEVRIACMERLRAAKYKPAVDRYVQLLKSKDNHLVNLAGVGLGYMKDSAAVPALIDALVTSHKHTISPGGQPGQISTGFGSGTGGGAPGFSFGQAQPQVVTLKQQNQDVLRTLVALAGVNFDFNVPAWKYWYANQKKPATLDSRRDKT